jgi:hypothetical protein
MFVGMGANSPSGYNITDSLRFRSTATTYLSRTPTVVGNQTTWTWSAWVKRSEIATQSGLFSAYNNDNNRTSIIFRNDDELQVFRRAGGTNTFIYRPTMLFRDTSAWYHIVVKMDQSQSTASDRLQIYVNGQLLTNDNGGYPALNEGGTINNTQLHTIGRQGLSGGSYYFDGYITEVNHIDGQALDADSFGEFNDDGVWQPKKYTGTYGTNGFYLKGCRGTDQSGNGNDFTENNFNTTSTSVNYDLMSDVPTLTDEDTANTATYNILFPLSTSTVDNGNIRLVNSGTASWRHAISSIALPKTGKWYFEMAASADTNNGTMGLAPVESLANGSNAYVTDAILTNTPNSSGTASGGLTGSTGNWTGTYNINALDALACAVDMDNNKVWFRIGANWVNAGSGAGDPSAGTNPAVSGGINSSKTYHFVTSAYQQNHYVNFGQRPFAYTVPTGFKKLNTYNLPDSDITDGSEYMNTVTYTGDGDLTSHPITGVGFSPDWIWIKRRDGANSHQTYDSVRTLGYVLSTDKTNAEADETSKFVSIDSDGFTIKSNAGSHNLLNADYVTWNWRGSDSTAVSNTVGSITSTVSANTTSGFSIVTYTGSGNSSDNVGTGLSTPLTMAIVKRRDSTSEWQVGHIGNQGSNFAYHLELNTYIPSSGAAPYFMGSQNASNGDRLYLSSGALTSGATYVAYCFTEVEGFSKFGSYTGNGSADGPFIYTGFRPAFILTKNVDTGNAHWIIFDTTRNTYNTNNNLIYPSLPDAESSAGAYLDILSNGFKLRYAGGSALNNSGVKFLYTAFAENPFKNSLAR